MPCVLNREEMAPIDDSDLGGLPVNTKHFVAPHGIGKGGPMPKHDPVQDGGGQPRLPVNRIHPGNAKGIAQQKRPHCLIMTDG